MMDPICTYSGGVFSPQPSLRVTWMHKQCHIQMLYDNVMFGDADCDGWASAAPFRVTL